NVLVRQSKAVVKSRACADAPSSLAPDHEEVTHDPASCADERGLRLPSYSAGPPVISTGSRAPEPGPIPVPATVSTPLLRRCTALAAQARAELPTGSNRSATTELDGLLRKPETGAPRQFRPPRPTRVELAPPPRPPPPYSTQRVRHAPPLPRQAGSSCSPSRIAAPRPSSTGCSGRSRPGPPSRFRHRIPPWWRWRPRRCRICGSGWHRLPPPRSKVASAGHWTCCTHSWPPLRCAPWRDCPHEPAGPDRIGCGRAWGACYSFPSRFDDHLSGCRIW